MRIVDKQAGGENSCLQTKSTYITLEGIRLSKKLGGTKKWQKNPHKSKGNILNPAPSSGSPKDLPLIQKPTEPFLGTFCPLSDRILQTGLPFSCGLNTEALILSF